MAPRSTAYRLTPGGRIGARDDVSYYLTNFDGAEESAITEIADTLMGKQLKMKNFGACIRPEIFVPFRHFAPLPRMDG